MLVLPEIVRQPAAGESPKNLKVKVSFPLNRLFIKVTLEVPGITELPFAPIVFPSRRENRIGRVPYDPSVAVDTFFDIGYGDSTKIIFGQSIGAEFRIIDCYEASGEGLPH